jgi:peptide-methionine (R)-S-oxide reductase
MNRRYFLGGLTALGVTAFIGIPAKAMEKIIEKLALSEEEWRKKLTPQQFHILRKEGTEPAGSSPLNKEKRAGIFHCAGCDLPLFSSEHKYESGTGWPSFYQPIDEAHIGTKTDFKLVWPRKEYHCARCGGHQGHVFDDGPEPTGLRYCNNGLALTFKPKEAS